MFQFNVVAERLTSREFGVYDTFGIRALSKAADGGEKEVAYISDVACDGALAGELAAVCNRVLTDPAALLQLVLGAML